MSPEPRRPGYHDHFQSVEHGRQATRGLLATDHVILNHGQVTWTTPELAPPLLTTTPHQREDVSALDRFNVHRCPTRRVFSGTGIELMTCLPWLDTLTTGLPQPPGVNLKKSLFTNVALQINARAIGDGLRNFEPRSSEENDTRTVSPPSPSFHTTPTRRRLSLDIFNMYQPLIPTQPLVPTGLVAVKLELMTNRPRARDHNH
ncbi:uncharacterized protein TNCV_707981 [Trichonephila clavipes]|nr:uncharacterized protein TNCV_707981 [Trichonephila clavipes]